MPYRVLIVEDDPMAQQLFTIFVSQSPDYELVRAISNADLADLYCSGVDLILMDIRAAARSNGLDAAERIKKRYPAIKIIIVTSMPEYSYLRRAREIGVDSFWYKEVTEEPFFRLMDRTMAGERVFPEEAPTVMLGEASSAELTARELEVLKELVSGAANHEIGERLGMSERTVKAHVQNLMLKTGFDNRTELAVRARECGLVIAD